MGDCPTKANYLKVDIYLRVAAKVYMFFCQASQTFSLEEMGHEGENRDRAVVN